jgi:glyceraldehyde-3-phosphate dehydrogenase (NAD(P))
MTLAAGDVRVGLVGYGTIGRRLVSAVRDLPGFRMAGIAVRRPLPGLQRLAADGIAVHLCVEALLGDVDLVLDCTPRGTGEKLDPLYRAAGVRVIYQGGEPAGLADTDYCFGFGFDAARRFRSVRIPSCNTTALVRLAALLGGPERIQRLRAVIIRSATDPDKAFKGALNSLAAAAGRSHHAEDVRRFLPQLDIVTLAATAPVNCGHLASLFIEMRTAASAADIMERLAQSPRIISLSGGTGALSDMRRPGLSRHRQDCPSVMIWPEAISVLGREVALFAGIHMESIVVPETLDAMQAMTASTDHAAVAMALSDRTLALGSNSSPQESAVA